MGVTRILLLVSVAIWGLLCLVAIPNFAFSVWESIRVVFYKKSGFYLPLSMLITEWAYFVIPLSLAYCAANDLKSVPARVEERFSIKYLGILGYLGLLSIVGACLMVWRDASLFWLPYFELLPDQDPILVKIEIVFNTIRSAALYFWFGALCLYARYRIAANKRLGVM